ncbi:aspartate:alanine exchanger family transporter [Corynebacterium sp.]|uniref:aspartate:alanine exchanger family transporter n=1 Tax=Corynebacterium sp. TaxID=1720 RepID=UPI0026DC71EF|nr:aspartate:alanine exchanger family transporter [Corynebacterium sp.]MDO5031258.1 aspartate:alanine exchanger family transporter [Corynebacterium sp.]
MLDFLASQPLLTLFLIMAVGLAVGKTSVAGVSLGAAAAMFVALGLSAANPEIVIPPLIYQFGLALFVYVIGLNFGRSFFRDFRGRGWKLSLLIVVMLVVLAAVTAFFIRAFNLDPAIGVGTLAGSITSTPGMAAIVEAIGGDTSPVVGYSLTYPGSVIGTILVAAIGAKLLKVNHIKDATEEGMIAAPLEWKALRVTRDVDATLAQVPAITGQRVVVTRVVHGPDSHELAQADEPLRAGMVLILNGTADALAAAIAQLGEEAEVNLHDRDGLIFRRVTVSNPEVAGHRLDELDIAEHGFLIARVRAGDSDVVPAEDTVLNYSDRVRVVTTPNRLDSVRRYLGDSETTLGNVDLLPFSLGLLLGLLLGVIPIPLPGGSALTFGFGGGPIVMGLILGALGRSGPVNWQLPFHAKQTLSALGLTLFLAGVGTSAGGSFREALQDPASFTYIGVGLALTLISALGLLLVSMVLFKLKFDEGMGVVAGMTTNPAIMAYLNPQTGTQLAERGYATVYPTAMIGKILACQMLALLIV